MSADDHDDPRMGWLAYSIAALTLSISVLSCASDTTIRAPRLHTAPPQRFGELVDLVLNELDDDARSLLMSEDFMRINVSLWPIAAQNFSDVVTSRYTFRGSPTGLPDGFVEADHMCKVLSALSTAATRRLRNDKELARHYDSLESSLRHADTTADERSNLRIARAAFRRSLRAVLRGTLELQVSALQLLSDMKVPERRAVADPPLRFDFGNPSMKTAKVVGGHGFLGMSASLLHVDVTGPPQLDHEKLSPTGRVWIAARPRLSCAHPGRACYEPHSCQRVCNMAYLGLRSFDTKSRLEVSLAVVAKGQLANDTRQRHRRIRIGAAFNVDQQRVKNTAQVFTSRLGAAPVATATADCDVGKCPSMTTVRGEGLSGMMQRLFDDNGRHVAILQIAADSLESCIVSKWLLHALEVQGLEDVDSTLLPDQIEVDLLLARPDDRARVSDRLLWLTLFISQMAALGYLPVDMEWNHARYERHFVLFTHTRSFIVSQVWIEINERRLLKPRSNGPLRM